MISRAFVFRRRARSEKRLGTTAQCHVTNRHRPSAYKRRVPGNDRSFIFLFIAFLVQYRIPIIIRCTDTSRSTVRRSRFFSHRNCTRTCATRYNMLQGRDHSRPGFGANPLWPFSHANRLSCENEIYNVVNIFLNTFLTEKRYLAFYF